MRLIKNKNKQALTTRFSSLGRGAAACDVAGRGLATLLVLLFISITGFCQAQAYNGSVNSLVAIAGKYQAAHQPEKLYLQLDRNNYGLRDTVWFKAYLFNAASLGSSTLSNLVYIEISNESNLVVLRRLVPMSNGSGSGGIALDKRDFPEGGYTLRAYTQWMRNFPENYIFKKQFFVNDLNKYRWLLKLTSATKDNNAQLHLDFYQTNKQPVSNQVIQVGVKQGDRVLSWDKVQTTSPFGGMDLSIPLPAKPDPRYAVLQKAITVPGGGFAGLSSTIEADKTEPLYKFPIIISRPEKTDLQFMPEGGNMVAGLNTVIGFKAIGEDGKGIDIAGAIMNSRNEQVATFKSGHKGMGSFPFKPEAGMVYNAVVALPDGAKKTYPLPAVKPAGTVLNVTNIEKPDSVAIRVSSTVSDGHYILVGQSRGLICYAAKVILANNSREIKAPKSAFATGIVRFTLLNEQLGTLNERVIYIDNHDKLQLTVTADKPAYSPQDSIALHVEVKDSKGKPVQGTFSMSVINSMQLNSNKDSTSIAANLLLTSNLQGDIEEPLYYFGNDEHRFKALDELLLTQGWVGFDWKDIFKPESKPAFAAEPDFSITGKVTNVFNKGVKDLNVNLMSLRTLYGANVKTDENGVFILKDIPLMDSTFFLSAKNDKGKQATYEILVDKPEWPVFINHTLQMPWYVNTDKEIMLVADTILKQQSIVEKVNGGGKMLKEVTIKDKKIVEGSHNLNGPGNADQVLDEKDINREPKITLLELLMKQVKGFGVYTRKGVTSYVVRYEPVVFIFDGIDVRFFIDNKVFSIYNNPDYDYYKELLTYYSSYDVKGIEVMSKAYLSQYVLNHREPRCLRCGPEPEHPYIEITTRQNIGLFLKRVPATIPYKPIPVVIAKEFYRPAYRIKNAAVAAYDQRSTIHWEPNIITDKDGKATVTFYAAGQPATYTITTEGSDRNGNVGSSIQKLTIAGP